MVMNMQHRTWTCSMDTDMQARHEARILSMDMQRGHEHASWTRHGHVLYCLYMYTDMNHRHGHGHGQTIIASEGRNGNSRSKGNNRS